MPDPVLPMDPLGPPGRLVRRACDRYGRQRVVEWCTRLLRGEPPRDDDPDISWLGGHHDWDSEWTRVWAARGLTHVHEPSADDAIAQALDDPAWRVREMALNAAAAGQLTGLIDEIRRLEHDPVERVARAAGRAAVALSPGLS